MSIWKRFSQVLERIYNKPWELKGRSFGFEKSFESLLYKEGILSLPLIGYERHPNGTNHFPDFEIHDKRSFLSIELKTTKSNSVHLGQTWIQSDALYIIRYKPTSFQDNPTFISFGKDMKTEEEDMYYYSYKYELLKLREKYKGVSKNVKIYPCSALEYKIDTNKRKINFEIVMEYLKKK
jgi:hypothetical protein